MSEAAAAFFANKKKKKAFKFNANLIDANTISSTVHIAAPAISTTSQDYAASYNGVDGQDMNDPASNQTQHKSALADESKEADNGAMSAGDQWDDEALAATLTTKKSVATPAVAEVLDMQSMDPKRRDQEHIADKLRVEETKAKLAAAREGMEREAEKVRLEKERKQQEAAAKAAATAPRFAAARVGGGGGGGATGGSGIWVPKHKLGAGGGGGGVGPASRSRFGAAAGAQPQKFDVENEELFPDLAAADKILEKKEKQQQVAFKVPKKTPVGGGASWASKTSSAASKAVASAAPVARAPSAAPKTAAPAPTPARPVASPSKPATEAPPATQKEDESAKAAAAAALAKTPVKKTTTKKKKKDLSTFKPS